MPEEETVKRAEQTLKRESLQLPQLSIVGSIAVRVMHGARDFDRPAIPTMT
jgi:hypothetical protein